MSPAVKGKSEISSRFFAEREIWWGGQGCPLTREHKGSAVKRQMCAGAERFYVETRRSIAGVLCVRQDAATKYRRKSPRRQVIYSAKA